MMDSPYKTPETHPGLQPKPPTNKNGWSNARVCLVTFFPMFLCLFCGGLMIVDNNLFELFLFLVPLAAIICAIATSIQFYSSKGFHIVGQLLLWGVVHTANIFVGFFGCIVILDTTSTSFY